MKKTLFFFLILSYGVGNLVAQAPKIFWGEPFRQSMFSGLSELVARDKYGYYTINNKGLYNSTMILHRYDNKFNEAGELELNPTEKGKKRSVETFASFPSSLHLMTVSDNKKEKEKHLYAQEINTQRLALKGEEKELLHVDYEGVSRSRSGFFTYKVSKDSSKFLVATAMPFKGSREPDRFSFSVFSDDLTKLWTQDHTFPYADRLFTLDEYKVDNEGTAYCIGRVDTDFFFDKRRGKPTYTYHILCISPNYATPIDIPLDIKEHFLTDLQLTFAPNGDIICAGFYSENTTFNVEGVFSIIIDGVTKKIKAKDFEPIPIQTIVENESEAKQERLEKKEKKGKNVELFEYDLAEIIPKSDGSGYLVVGEQFYITTYDTYDMASKSYRVRYVYHYNDIIVVSMNNNGEISWAKKIGKHQITTDDLGIFSSYALAVVGDKLHFVFNDHKDNVTYNGEGRPKTMRFGSNNLTTLVSLDAKGNMTRRGLFDKDEAEAYAIPKMSVQTSPNDLVIYFQRFGKRRFAKITF